MTEPRSPGVEAITAGWRLIGAMLTCAAAGYGIGAIIGIAVPLGLLGFFVGLGVGFYLVYARYRRV